MVGRACYRMSIFIALASLAWGSAGPAEASTEACQSLAAIYARTPQYLDAKELVALQRCLDADAKEKADPPEQQPRREWGEWPASSPWTVTPESWPSPNPW